MARRVVEVASRVVVVVEGVRRVVEAREERELKVS